MAAFDAVLKVGGSLGGRAVLRDLGRALGALADRHRLLAVPGGGVFADLVRRQHRSHGLSEPAAHRMALLAMDQFGYLLAEYVPGALVTPDLGLARRAAARGELPILLPASLLMQADPLPNSWQVTSDSLAAWIAGVAGAARLVLLKDVDGLFQGEFSPGARRRGRAEARRAEAAGAGGAWVPGLSCGASEGAVRLWAELSPEALAAHRGGVDESLAGLPLETWVINGRRPERLAELLAAGTTLGTRIRPRSG